MKYGSHASVTHYRDGEASDSYSTYTETVKVTAETEVLAEFLKLMEFVKQPGRFDPAFEVKSDRRTYKPLRVIKRWSEI